MTVEGLLPAVIFFGFAVFAIFAIAAGIQAQKRFNAAMEEAARALGGTFERASFGTRPRIGFRVQGRSAEVTFKAGSKNSPPATTVAIDASGVSRGALKIYPEGFGASIAKFFGAQDVRIGDPEFDGMYVVKATPESLAHEVFRAEQRSKAVALVRRVGMRQDPLIDLSRSQLVVRVREYLNDECDVVSLARAAEGLYNCICGAAASPMETAARAETVWVDDGAAVGAQCQVCGAAMEKDIVHCAKCRTPHHRECWEFNDGCSTFACGGKEYA